MKKLSALWHLPVRLIKTTLSRACCSRGPDSTRLSPHGFLLPLPPTAGPCSLRVGVHAHACEHARAWECGGCVGSGARVECKEAHVRKHVRGCVHLHEQVCACKHKYEKLGGPMSVCTSVSTCEQV